MRIQQGAVRRYAPGSVPDDTKDIPRFLREEFANLQACLSSIADGQLDITTVAPTKPRNGMIRYTDAVNWNPGAGRGFYGYDNGSWKLLG